MTIYSQISKNKLRTYFIILLFIMLTSGFFYILGKFLEAPGFYFTFGLLFALTSSVGSYFYSDKIVLYTVNAAPANKKEHFNFYTVCENLSIAAGLPIPKLYVINDLSPNAFATGRNPKHSIVCVTTGLLEQLDRAELEGVISHELSHVKNYDILVSTIVAVLVGTIAIVADWVMRGFWFRDSNEDNRKNPVFFILLVAALILTPIAATLIQLAVSRKREFLADASGALLTRNPDALAQALIKISSDPHHLRHVASSTAHLFISNPLKKKNMATSWVVSLFSTHPPIEERVRILREI